MQRTKTWILLVLGFDKSPRNSAPAPEATPQNEHPAAKPVATILILIIRLLVVFSVVLGLIIKILEML